MFLLPQDQLPATAEALEGAMEEALRGLCTRAEPMVAIDGTDLRDLDRMAVNLSGGVIELPPRPKMAIPSQGDPAVFVRELSVQADPITVVGNTLRLQLAASGVEFDQAKGSEPGIFLILRRAASGSINLSIERQQLEQIIAKAAAIAAKKQGVSIENVSLVLTPRGPRALDARISVTARKLLFRAVIHLSGSAALDDNFAATISNLRCEGDGAIATLACAAMTPQFQKIENRPLPLSALPIGEVRLNDVNFAVDDERIMASAQFGSASSRPG